MNNLTATFRGTGRRPQCPPDPAYPNGKPINVAGDAPGCTIELDHPTPECGVWVIECSICGYRLGVTAAGRPDDPSTVKLPCRLEGTA